ncbi:MAG: inner-rane translocator [Frankiales bacterium]|nr:inner-rane translocator [Frankiales bacterium]
MCCLLAQGARLLLLDEPTAGVAQRETEAFGPLIERIRSELDATVVIIEHDIPLIMSISHRVYCYAAGSLIAQGSPEQVRNDPAVVSAYLGTDQRAIDRSDTRPTAKKTTARATATATRPRPPRRPAPPSTGRPLARNAHDTEVPTP